MTRTIPPIRVMTKLQKLPPHPRQSLHLSLKPLCSRPEQHAQQRQAREKRPRGGKNKTPLIRSRRARSSRNASVGSTRRMTRMILPLQSIKNAQFRFLARWKTAPTAGSVLLSPLILAARPREVCFAIRVARSSTRKTVEQRRRRSEQAVARLADVGNCRATSWTGHIP